MALLTRGFSLYHQPTRRVVPYTPSVSYMVQTLRHGSSAQPEYDLCVIGSGPAGRMSAIAAAKMGKKVCIVDGGRMFGGVCVHTGTIPSKTLREAIMYLSGYRQRFYYGSDYQVKADICPDDLLQRVQRVVKKETAVVTGQVKRNGVHVHQGYAKFLSPNEIHVDSDESDTGFNIKSKYFMVACGTRPARNNAKVPFDGKKIFDADEILSGLEIIPKDLVVIGGGVIGIEYASMLACNAGTRVTVIDERPQLLDFCDRELIESLMYQMRRMGATFRLGEKMESCHVNKNGKVVVELLSGKKVFGDSMLYAVGRQSNTDKMDIEKAGLTPDNRGRLLVNEFFQTEQSHIYAAGDVIGQPALASSSMEQGRNATRHMFGLKCEHAPELFPYGIYTVPEMSMVGRSEQELTAAGIPYEYGVSRYDELAKGLMRGDEVGVLKILFCPTTLKVLGVHVIGEMASEIVHIGQTVIAFGGNMHYFRDTCFNYPTFAEAYKVAALDGLNKISAEFD